MNNMNNATISVPVKQQSNVAEQLTFMNKKIMDIFQALDALTAELTMITMTQPPAEDDWRDNDTQRSMCNLALEIATKNKDLGMIESRIQSIRKSLDV